MPFKMKYTKGSFPYKGESHNFVHEGGYKVIKKDLDDGVLGEANNDGTIYVDNYYIVLDPYEGTQEDETSQNKYGVREKTFIAREFFSNEECNAVGIILLNNLKNPVQKFNITAEGFIDVYPNSVFTFKYDDEEYNKPLVNITYYVNEDGSESMQFTVGDYKRDDVDVILDKFVEINRNADLLKNPYKIA